jgi:hypothetical protein
MLRKQTDEETTKPIPINNKLTTYIFDKKDNINNNNTFHMKDINSDSDSDSDRNRNSDRNNIEYIFDEPCDSYDKSPNRYGFNHKTIRCSYDDDYYEYYYQFDPKSFYEACEYGDLNVVQEIFNINKSFDFNIALVKACEYHNLNIIEWLYLQEFIDPTDAFIMAYRKGYLEILKFLEGSDIAGYNILYFDIPMLFEEFHRAVADVPSRLHQGNNSFRPALVHFIVCQLTPYPPQVGSLKISDDETPSRPTDESRVIVHPCLL